MSLLGNAKAGAKLRGKINKLESIRGYSAYEVARMNGFEGTEEEWLDSLKGKSAYAYAQEGGYTGTEAEFAEKLAQVVSK